MKQKKKAVKEKNTNKTKRRKLQPPKGNIPNAFSLPYYSRMGTPSRHC